MYRTLQVVDVQKVPAASILVRMKMTFMSKQTESTPEDDDQVQPTLRVIKPVCLKQYSDVITGIRDKNRMEKEITSCELGNCFCVVA